VASKSLLLAELARVTEETGAGLLLASDELDDLVICDRVIVLVRGERFTEFREPPFDREALIAASEGMARAADRDEVRPGEPRPGQPRPGQARPGEASRDEAGPYDAGPNGSDPSPDPGREVP
jgi:hypothetical protein